MRDPDKPCTAGEGQHLDRKSLRIVRGKTANFSELAQECVGFANGSGGRLLIGIEDGAT
jgi:ATP-dependent DNA helicase RecG